MKNIDAVFNKIFGLVFGICLIVGLVFHYKLLLVPINNIINGVSFSETVAAVESTLAEGFYRKSDFVTFNGLVHKVMLQRCMNNVTLLNNGHGSTPMGNCADKILIDNANAIKKFADWCELRNATLLFAQEPFKNEKGNSQLPIGVIDYSNEIADRFGQELEILGVDYLDLRDGIEGEKGDFYSFFYKTEHHWNCFGGFYGFVQLCEYMSEHYKDEINPKVLDIDNYEIDTYKDVHSGYYGSCVGNVFLPAEDFYLLYPKFNTNQTCQIVHKKVTRNGSFYDAVYDQSFLYTDKIHGMYAAYIGGDFPLVIHKSETAEIDETIIVFIDSFGTIPESFLTTVYKRVIAVDLRWVLRNRWDVTAADYVEQYDADHVIVMLNPTQLIYENSEQFEYGVK